MTAKVYRRGRRDAIKETGLPAARLPSACPFSLEQVLDHDYRPD